MVDTVFVILHTMSDFPPNILCKTSSAADGNMSFRIGETDNSLQNREQFLMNNGIDFKNHVCMKCDHGEQITTVNRSTENQKDGTFGSKTQEDMLLSEVLVTQEKGLALMLLTADCMPVSLYDPITQTIALAHFSRETISKNLPQKTISLLRERFAVDPANLLINVGPYIHTDSYSFPANNHNIQSNILPFTKEIDDKNFVDLIAACNQQLTQAGVELANIAVSTINTHVSPNHFSHYASRTQNTLKGRLATVLMMK